MGIRVTLTCDKCGEEKTAVFDDFPFESNVMQKLRYGVVEYKGYILCNECICKYISLIELQKENKLQERKKFFANAKKEELIIEEVNV